MMLKIVTKKKTDTYWGNGGGRSGKEQAVFGAEQTITADLWHVREGGGHEKDSEKIVRQRETREIPLLGTAKQKAVHKREEIG